jgi:serine/threonine protein phosphatase PrpC
VGAALGVVGLSFVAGTLAAERTEDEDVPRMGERAAEPSTPKRSQKQTVAGGVAGANNAAKKRKPAPSGVLPSKGVGKDVRAEKATKSANNNNVFSGMMKAAGSTASSKRAAPKYDWGVAQADGPREYMEDAWFVNPSGFADGYFFAGVADGHGGSASSAYLRERLFESLNAYVGGSLASNANAPGDAPDGTPGGGYLADALDRGFCATDSKLIDHVASLGEPECWSGSTCTVALVREDRVVCANVGDSRALLVRTGRGASKGIELSSDHRPVGSCKTGRQELDRVVRAGGWSVGGRVCGILAVSRAFGDYEFKGGRFDLLEDLSEEPLAKKATLDSPPVIANPAVFECARSAEDEWLVLASDGLWDTVNSAQCATFIKQETKKKPDMNADELANALVKRALRFRTQDNVAVVVVDLRSAT